MSRRVGVVGVLAVLLLAAAHLPVHAQENSSSTDLKITITPYLWLPTLNLTAHVPTLGGGTGTVTSSSSPWDYLPHLNLAGMVAGEARYDRLSLLTDFIYLNAQGTDSRLRSFDQGPIHIPVNASATMRIESAIWTLAGAYTVAEGNWGNVDLLAGFRFLYINETTNFGLLAAVPRPDGTIALGRTGSLPASRDIWNGIGGMRARIYLADADWFGGGRVYVPFYFDIGGGGSNLTFQVFSGVGYQIGRLSLSIGYRHLNFNQGSSDKVEKLSMGGPILTASISF